MSDVREFFRKLGCRFYMHPRLDVIQSFGSAQHVGCPYCRRQYGMHHGMQVVIPWTPDLAELYQLMGYDTETATQRWQRVQP